MPKNVFTVHGAYPEPLWHGCAYTMTPHSQLRFLPQVGVVHSTVYLHCTLCIYIYILTATLCMRDDNGLVIYIG